jgi:hypothetical protein
MNNDRPYVVFEYKDNLGWRWRIVLKHRTVIIEKCCGTDAMGAEKWNQTYDYSEQGPVFTAYLLSKESQ